jgi:hypothetical protein
MPPLPGRAHLLTMAEKDTIRRVLTLRLGRRGPTGWLRIHSEKRSQATVGLEAGGRRDRLTGESDKAAAHCPT